MGKFHNRVFNCRHSKDYKPLVIIVYDYAPVDIFKVARDNDADIDPNGMYDVIAHGNWKEIEVFSGGRDIRVDSRQAAKLIKKQPGFKKAKAVRLLSCNTGSHPEGFAQHLANALGKPVYAPNMTIHSYPNGTHWISDNSKKGDFVKFVPGGVKHGRK